MRTHVVQQGSTVLVDFILKLQDGSVAESTYDNGRPVLFRLDDDSLSAPLKAALVGGKTGEKRSVTLQQNDAFGPFNPDLIQYFSRVDFAQTDEPAVGMIMLFSGMAGDNLPGVIREIDGDAITVDFNHPLAGHSVDFELEIIDIDPKTERRNASSVG
ncbi:MAG: FKBP-type 16 kDa peptidyl-prolyl cis-trans isomerase [Candidatus Erwinia impunctatus]|nr:FKBP-type 16 kDa peptidyl-prolyl cis-trans isomerase [Culicoides impunctatus]